MKRRQLETVLIELEDARQVVAHNREINLGKLKKAKVSPSQKTENSKEVKGK